MTGPDGRGGWNLAAAAVHRSRRIVGPAFLLAVVATLAACGDASVSRKSAGADTSGTVEGEDGVRCAAPHRTGWVPDPIRESSGLAFSRAHPGVLWTHDDSGGEPRVFAIDSAGDLLGVVRVRGARNEDWEDIAVGPCSAGSCLFIGDIGDNRLVRPSIEVYRVPEPSPGDARTEPAERLTVRYPDGPHDAEALAVSPDGAIWIVTKGRIRGVVVYRTEPDPPPGEVTLRALQVLSPARQTLPDEVTGADMTPDGRWLVIRSYTSVQIYRVTGRGELDPVLPGTGVSLVGLREPQGEAVAVRADGTLALGGERPAGEPAPISEMRCTLPAG